MKKMLTLVLVSVLGGAITLGTYKTFLEKDEQQIANTTTQETPVYLPANYNTNTTALAAAEGINFTTAADKTVHAVVHVKNVAVNKNVRPNIQDFYIIEFHNKDN